MFYSSKDQSAANQKANLPYRVAYLGCNGKDIGDHNLIYFNMKAALMHRCITNLQIVNLAI